MAMATTERRAIATLCLCFATMASPCRMQAAEEQPLPISQSCTMLKDCFIKASFLSAKGQYEEAIDLYRRIGREAPTSAVVPFAIAKGFLSLGELDSARAYGEKSVLLNPNNKYPLSLLASIAHSMRDYDRAAALYSRLSELDPGNTDILSFLGMEYIAAGRQEEALKVFHEILRLDPANDLARAEQLLLQIRLMRYEDAIATLNALVAEGKAGEKLQLTLCELYLRQNDFAAARDAVDRLLASYPRFVPAWITLFDISIRSANLDAFRRELPLFYETFKPDMDRQLELGRFYLSRSLDDSLFTEPALLLIDEIIRRNPNHPEPLVLAGQARLMHGEPAVAIKEFSKALSLQPDSIDVWEDLVAARVALRDFGGAQATLEDAQRRFPDDGLRLSALEGYLLAESDRLAAAVRVLEEVLHASAIVGDRRLQLRTAEILAYCYDRLGEESKGIPLYETMLRLDPQNALAMNNLAYILARQGRDLHRAKALAGGAVMDDPESAVYLDTLGWVLFRMGEYGQSRQILEKAALIDPAEKEIFEHLAEVYRALGDKSHERSARERIRELEQGQKLGE